jgi:homocysteine S-methyltransferase
VKYAGNVTRQRQPVLLDGGLATELEAAGAVLDTALWSAALLQSDPAAIRAAHRAYLDAGAEIVTSASYQASRAGFGRLGLSPAEADGLIVSSVQLAREACDAFAGCHPAMPPRRVAASVGPYGAILHDGSEYTGNYGLSAEALREFHVGRLLLLDGAGADLLAVETIPSLAEARVLAALLARCRTPAWVSFSCRDEHSISDGTAIEDAARLFEGHPTVFALGVNCTAPRYLPGLLERLRESAPDKILVAYPNAGEVYDAATREWSGTADTARFAHAAAEWFVAGASWIGGCCRIGPAHIASLRARWSGSGY